MCRLKKIYLRNSFYKRANGNKLEYMAEKGLILYTDESLRGKGGFVGYVGIYT